MIDAGQFIFDGTPAELDRVDDEIVTRFIEGQASPEELAELRTGRLVAEPDLASHEDFSS